MHMQMHGCSYVLIKSLLNIMSHDNEWMCNNIRYTNLETRKAKQTGYFSSMNVECSLNQIRSIYVHSTEKCTHSVKFIQFCQERTLVHRDCRCCKSIGPFVWHFECFVLTGVVAATATIQPPLPLMWLAFIVIVASFCLCTQFDHTFRCAYKDISINKPTFCCAIRSTMRRTFICCIRALTSLSHVFFFFLVVCVFFFFYMDSA